MITETKIIHWLGDFVYEPLIKGFSGDKFLKILKENPEFARRLLKKNLKDSIRKAGAYYNEKIEIANEDSFVEDTFVYLRSRFLPREQIAV